MEGFDDITWDFSSAFRGIFFKILKRKFCFKKNISCANCGFEDCLYYNIFEKKYGDYLRFHPYIIEHLETGKNKLIVNYKFFGRFAENFNDIMNTILQTQTEQLRYKNKYYSIRINSINDDSSNSLYEENRSKIYIAPIKKISYLPQRIEQIRLTFLTPFRIKYKNKLSDEFKIDAFMRNLKQRVNFFYKYFESERSNIPAIKDYDGIEFESQTKWVEMIRHSNRQNKKMKLGGILGKVILKNLSSEVYGLIKIGEIIHVGKQTTFGLGKYVVEDLP